MSSAFGCEILAISSSGGHWVELTRLFEALEGFDAHYACTDAGRSSDVPAGRFHVIPDANKQTPGRVLVCAHAVARLVLGLRPRVIVTTGAAPGLLALAAGKVSGARGVWIDTVGLVDRMSLSGRLARPFAEVRLVQWPHLAKSGGPQYRGSVL